MPRDLFDARRYEGSDADERRLFYVALTRARDWVVAVLAPAGSTSRRGASPRRTSRSALAFAMTGGLPTARRAASGRDPDLAITYSELAAYLSCPQSYLLRNELGFMPPIQAELGYGNAVHHVMRVIAEQHPGARAAAHADGRSTTC